MTLNTYTVAGTSSLNGVTKVRFANDLVNRTKALIQNGHTDVVLIENADGLSKAAWCELLLNHEKFQSELQQSAIAGYVRRRVGSSEISQDLTVQVELADA